MRDCSPSPGRTARSQSRIGGVPIDHVKLPVSDLDASRAFYSAALAPFGYRLVYDEEPTLGFGTGDGGDDDEPFALRRAGGPQPGAHIAFTASSIEDVDAFHAAALEAGGRDNGAPGSVPTAATTTPPSSSTRTDTTSRPCTTDRRSGDPIRVKVRHGTSRGDPAR